IGSRWVPGGEVRNWPWLRQFISKGGNLYARLTLRFPVRDATGGYRAYRRVVLETLKLDEVASQGYCFQIDLAWKTWREGFRVAGSLIGGWLLRREGTRAWRAFTVAVAEGRPPGREVLDGLLVLVGGALVLFPGFVSDVLGLLCLLPLTRRALGGLARRYVGR